MTKTLKNCLNDMKKAINGNILLSDELDVALNSIKDGTVPEMWVIKSYLFQKKLVGYISHFKERLK